MSNQIFSNETEKYIQGRQVFGIFADQPAPLTNLAAIIIESVTTNDLPVDVTLKSVIFNEAMVVYVSYTLRYKHFTDPGIGTFREADILSSDEGSVADNCVPPNTLNDVCLNLSAIVNVSAGGTIEFRASSDVADSDIGGSASTWSITRIY